ncbi:hypothetical protein PIB30_052808 [Stylosanthes scabra]|uniref:Ubiquitin-like protease family profile domain-containing protein n=1 Tax=Stylosanthes scabra TaxID=79078 RepID=A0ABU6XGT7_9FABA|nr:hypothetical protein [Stylosanthes scabra]
MRAAIQAFDNIDKLDTTAQDAENEEEPKTPRKRLYKWATEGEGNMMYKFLFRFITGKPYEAVREHFMSLAREGEMDLSIMHIMCIFHNRKNNERFQDMIYCVPPYFMYHLLQKVHHKYFDPETNLPFALSTLSGNDLFAPLLYVHHWWLYVLDVNHKKFYVLDPLNPKNQASERKKIHIYVSNVLDQMIVYAGGNTMFPGPITTQVATHSLLPKLIHVPKQHNQYDCGVHVLKYLEVVNPIELNKKSYKIPVSSQEQFDEYREAIVERILLDNDNYYTVEAVQATVPTHRQSKPSHHLQSPYVLLNSSYIESGKSKDK